MSDPRSRGWRRCAWRWRRTRCCTWTSRATSSPRSTPARAAGEGVQRASRSRSRPATRIASISSYSLRRTQARAGDGARMHRGRSGLQRGGDPRGDRARAGAGVRARWLGLRRRAGRRRFHRRDLARDPGPRGGRSSRRRTAPEPELRQGGRDPGRAGSRARPLGTGDRRRRAASARGRRRVARALAARRRRDRRRRQGPPRRRRQRARGAGALVLPRAPAAGRRPSSRAWRCARLPAPPPRRCT